MKPRPSIHRVGDPIEATFRDGSSNAGTLRGTVQKVTDHYTTIMEFGGPYVKFRHDAQSVSIRVLTTSASTKMLLQSPSWK